MKIKENTEIMAHFMMKKRILNENKQTAKLKYYVLNKLGSMRVLRLSQW